MLFFLALSCLAAAALGSVAISTIGAYCFATANIPSVARTLVPF